MIEEKNRGRPLELQTTLFPSTAAVTDQRYVCLTLNMKFSPDYPEEPPQLELKNPRGLGEDFLANVLECCKEKCATFAGSPVMYEVLEVSFIITRPLHYYVTNCVILLSNIYTSLEE